MNSWSLQDVLTIVPPVCLPDGVQKLAMLQYPIIRIPMVAHTVFPRSTSVRESGSLSKPVETGGSKAAAHKSD
jgi:hypothetical protein